MLINIITNYFTAGTQLLSYPATPGEVSTEADIIHWWIEEGPLCLNASMLQKMSRLTNSPGNSPGAAAPGYLVVVLLEVYQNISCSHRTRRTISP